jgi:hypothetical protein
MHADPQADALVGRRCGVAQADPRLDRNGGLDRAQGAAEFDQCPIPGELDDTPASTRHLGIEQLAADGLERPERGLLVARHQTAVADHVGSEDGGEATVHDSAYRSFDRTTLAHCT